jgi:hypothetical protein
MRLTRPSRQFFSGVVLAAILFSQQVVSQSQSPSPSSADSTATTKGQAGCKQSELHEQWDVREQQRTNCQTT